MINQLPQCKEFYQKKKGMTGNFLNLSCDRLQLQAHRKQVDQEGRLLLPAENTAEKTQRKFQQVVSIVT